MLIEIELNLNFELYNCNFQIKSADEKNKNLSPFIKGIILRYTDFPIDH